MLGVRLYAALSPRSRHVRLTLRVKCRFSLRTGGVRMERLRSISILFLFVDRIDK